MAVGVGANETADDEGTHDLGGLPGLAVDVDVEDDDEDGICVGNVTVKGDNTKGGVSLLFMRVREGEGIEWDDKDVVIGEEGEDIWGLFCKNAAKLAKLICERGGDIDSGGGMAEEGGGSRMCNALPPRGEREGTPGEYMEPIIDAPKGWKHCKTMAFVNTICRSPSKERPSTWRGSLNSFSTMEYN